MIGIYSAVSGMQVNQAKMEAVANNLANVNSEGFKEQVTSISSAGAQISRTASQNQPAGIFSGLGAQVAATPILFNQGPLQRTDVPTDLGISGRGFFAVQSDTGRQFLTRAGNFIKDTQGGLRTPGGLSLLDTGGAPIQIPANATSFSIGRDGAVTAVFDDGTSGQVGTVGLMNVPNENALMPEAESLYSTTAASGAATRSQPGTNGLGYTQSGMLEMSNVDMASQMVEMIQAQRGFEANVKTVQATDEMLKSLLASRK